MWLIWHVLCSCTWPSAQPLRYAGRDLLVPTRVISCDDRSCRTFCPVRSCFSRMLKTKQAHKTHVYSTQHEIIKRNAPVARFIPVGLPMLPGSHGGGLPKLASFRTLFRFIAVFGHRP